MNQKTIFITGASSGFGHLTATRLLAEGHTVYAMARTLEKMEDLKENGANVFQGDVRKIEDIQKVVETLIEQEGKIDAVLANAGYGEYGMIEAVPMEDIENQFNINVFGVARTLKVVLPHMRMQRHGRIVITESIVSHITTLGLGWYASTKHALRGMSIALRQEVKDFGIEVVAIEPGAIDTNFAPVAFKALDENRIIEDYYDLSDGFKAYMLDSYSKAPDSESTAKAMVEALTTEKPKTIYKTTPDAKFGPTIIGMVKDKTYDNLILGQVKKALKNDDK